LSDNFENLVLAQWILQELIFLHTKIHIFNAQTNIIAGLLKFSFCVLIQKHCSNLNSCNVCGRATCKKLMCGAQTVVLAGIVFLSLVQIYARTAILAVKPMQELEY